MNLSKATRTSKGEGRNTLPATMMELRREELLVYRKSTTLLQTFKQFRCRIVSAEACGLRF